MRKSVGWMIPLLLLLMMMPAWSQNAPDELIVLPASKRVMLSGYTRSNARMIVSSEVSGKVLKVHYDVGQTIGTRPYLEVDPTFINLQIEQMVRALQRLSIVKARAASRAAYLEKEFKRIDRLFRDNAATGSGHDAAAQELSQAQMEMQATEAEINRMQSQLAELQERRDRHKVFVPRGWVLVGRQVEAGEIISAGAPLGQAADFSRLVIPLYVTAQELAVIEKLGTMELVLEGRKVQAGLNWVNPEFDEQTRKLAIELKIDEAGGVRRGGLLAELPLQVPAAEGLMVPEAAVVNRYDNPRVIMAESGNTVSIVILGENGDNLIIAADRELAVGARLQRLNSK
jgi:multidrug efflux pump subunit AcrA (membrane-fusion protein)